MSARAGNAPKASARRVQAVFELRGDSDDVVMASAAELIRTLHEVAATSKCQCDLDVHFDNEAPPKRLS